MAMTHERLAVSSGLHTILTNYRVSGSPNMQNPQPTTSLLVKYIYMICIYQNHPKSHASYPFSGEIAIIPEPEIRAFWVDWRNSPHAIVRCPAMGKLSRIPHDICQW